MFCPILYDSHLRFVNSVNFASANAEKPASGKGSQPTEGQATLSGDEHL
jgi:hypothetical protein